MRTRVPSSEIEWSVPLAEIPTAFSMDAMSQNVVPVGKFGSLPRFAVADSNQVSLMSLEDGALLKAFAVKIENSVSNPGISTSSLAALSFGDRGGEPLWTVERRNLNNPSSKDQLMVSVSAWDTPRGRRIASAEIPGHLLSATWSGYGMKLALVRLNEQGQGTRTMTMPWESPPVSPFTLHIWDVRIQQRSTSFPPKAISH
jgi:hypothetical protein